MKICKSRAKHREQEYAEVIISNALIKADLIENVTFKQQDKLCMIKKQEAIKLSLIT